MSPGCSRREKPHLAGESEEVAFEPNGRGQDGLSSREEVGAGAEGKGL